MTKTILARPLNNTVKPGFKDAQKHNTQRVHQLTPPPQPILLLATAPDTNTPPSKPTAARGQSVKLQVDGNLPTQRTMFNRGNHLHRRSSRGFPQRPTHNLPWAARENIQAAPEQPQDLIPSQKYEKRTRLSRYIWKLQESDKAYAGYGIRSIG